MAEPKVRVVIAFHALIGTVETVVAMYSRLNVKCFKPS